MTTNVFILRPTLADYDRREILRYARVGSPDEQLESLLEETLRISDGKITPRVCYAEYPLAFDGDLVKVGNISVRSKSLAKALYGCESAVILAATVGIEMDRLIRKYSGIEPSRALLLQAIGTERVEALCDVFCQILGEAKSGARLRPRFSPGYGDLPLEMQKDIFSLLGCPSNVGITLNEGLIMSPSKSVTAIVGIEKHPN